MFNLIVLIIFFISLIGVSVIILRKIPFLSELSAQEIESQGTFRKLKDKIQNNGFSKNFSSEILLQKILSKFRVLTLKTESKTNTWLSKLRQRSLKKKKEFQDDYWQKIKRKR